MYTYVAELKEEARNRERGEDSSLDRLGGRGLDMLVVDESCSIPFG